MSLGYYRNVAFELRMRGVTEKQVSFELSRIAAASSPSMSPPFGPQEKPAATTTAAAEAA